jgi:hypothetical protein
MDIQNMGWADFEIKFLYLWFMVSEMTTTRIYKNSLNYNVEMFKCKIGIIVGH